MYHIILGEIYTYCADKCESVDSVTCSNSLKQFVYCPEIDVNCRGLSIAEKFEEL